MATGVPHVIVLLNISKPWSEDEPGKSFEQWWSEHMGPRYDMLFHGSVNMPGQQHEWVCAMSGRAGVDGTLKPHSALDEALRIGKQPSGSAVVKIVLKPFTCTTDAFGESHLSLKVAGDRYFFVLRLSGDMVVQDVSRTNLHRGRPEDMRHQFTETRDFEAVTKTSFRLIAGRLNSLRVNKSKQNKTDVHRQLLALDSLKRVLDLAVSAGLATPGEEPLELSSTERNPVTSSKQSRVFGPQDVVDRDCLLFNVMHCFRFLPRC